jgi:hypothetical protein
LELSLISFLFNPATVLERLKIKICTYGDALLWALSSSGNFST